LVSWAIYLKEFEVSAERYALMWSDRSNYQTNFRV